MDTVLRGSFCATASLYFDNKIPQDEDDNSMPSSSSSSCGILLSKYKLAVAYEASDLLQFFVNSRPSMVSLAHRCASSSTCWCVTTWGLESRCFLNSLQRPSLIYCRRIVLR